MGSFSIWHWLIVLLIVVMVFGTKKLKNIGSDLGGAVKGFKDGMKDGEWVHTYANGKRSFVGRFVNGEPAGKHRWWWPNGELKAEARYSAGLLQGDVNYYDDQGMIYLTVRYKDGKELKLGDVPLPPPFEAGGAPE